MRRVLITGAGGAIGIHVIDHLMKNTDWFLVLTDSFQHKGYYDRISQTCENNPDYIPRLKIIQHDLIAPFTDREIEKMGKIDYVINLAARSDVKESEIDPVSFVKNNTDLMLTMLEYARKAKPEVFLHFSTDEVYGPSPKDSGGHKEWDSIIPSNPYSASKGIQEVLGISWWRSFGVPLIIVNTMNNFGEMQAPSKFPAMIQQKLEKGEEIDVHAATNGEIGTRYYLHSRNAADAVLFILKNVKPLVHAEGAIDLPERIHIVGDKQVSNLELAQIIARLMGKELKYKLSYFHDKHPGHDLHYGLNGEKLAKLGWKSPLSFEESLSKTIKWQKENPEWMK